MSEVIEVLSLILPCHGFPVRCLRRALQFLTERAISQPAVEKSCLEFACDNLCDACSHQMLAFKWPSSTCSLEKYEVLYHLPGYRPRNFGACSSTFMSLGLFCVRWHVRAISLPSPSSSCRCQAMATFSGSKPTVNAAHLLAGYAASCLQY